MGKGMYVFLFAGSAAFQRLQCVGYFDGVLFVHFDLTLLNHGFNY
jgi:hypothetical protein